MEGSLLTLGIAIGFVLGIFFDRYVLRAVLLPWLLSHGRR